MLRLAQKDRGLIVGLKRKGIKEADIQLMDRNDPTKPFNVRPFQGWIKLGRMVRKGEKSIRGLFHQSQTDELPKASAKPPPKGKAKPVAAKSQLPLV